LAEAQNANGDLAVKNGRLISENQKSHGRLISENQKSQHDIDRLVQKWAACHESKLSIEKQLKDELRIERIRYRRLQNSTSKRIRKLTDGATHERLVQIADDKKKTRKRNRYCLLCRRTSAQSESARLELAQSRIATVSNLYKSLVDDKTKTAQSESSQSEVDDKAKSSLD